MKNSGCGPEGDTQHILDFGLRHLEILGDVRDPIPRAEAIDEILHAGAPVDDYRLAERAAWIDDDLRFRIGRETERDGPPVIAVANRLEVLTDDFTEMLLTCPYDGEHLVRVSSGVVVNDLGAVRVQLVRGERMIEPDLLAKPLHRWPDPLHWDAGTTQAREHVCLGEADERNSRLVAACFTQRDERLPALRHRPVPKRRRCEPQIPRGFGQTEDRPRDSRVVLWQSLRCVDGGRDLGQPPI